MLQTFLLFDTITNEKTVKFMQRDVITSTITWHLGLVGSNNFGEYTSFSPFTLGAPACSGMGGLDFHWLRLEIVSSHINKVL